MITTVNAVCTVLSSPPPIICGVSGISSCRIVYHSTHCSLTTHLRPRQRSARLWHWDVDVVVVVVVVEGGVAVAVEVLQEDNCVIATAALGLGGVVIVLYFLCAGWGVVGIAGVEMLKGRIACQCVTKSVDEHLPTHAGQHTHFVEQGVLYSIISNGTEHEEILWPTHAHTPSPPRHILAHVFTSRLYWQDYLTFVVLITLHVMSNHSWTPHPVTLCIILAHDTSGRTIHAHLFPQQWIGSTPWSSVHPITSLQLNRC